MAWKACQATSTSGGSTSFVSHIRGIDEGARKVSSPTASRITAPTKSVVKRQLYHFPGPRVLLQISPVYDCCTSVHRNELSESVHSSEATFHQQAWYDDLNWTVAIFLFQELERSDQVVAQSLRRRARPRYIGISVVLVVCHLV